MTHFIWLIANDSFVTVNDVTYDEILEMNGIIQCISFRGTFDFRNFYFFRDRWSLRIFIGFHFLTWCCLYLCFRHLCRWFFLGDFKSPATFKAGKVSSAYRNILTHQNANFLMIQDLMHSNCTKYCTHFQETVHDSVCTISAKRFDIEWNKSGSIFCCG